MLFTVLLLRIGLRTYIYIYGASRETHYILGNKLQLINVDSRRYGGDFVCKPSEKSSGHLTRKLVLDSGAGMDAIMERAR